MMNQSENPMSQRGEIPLHDYTRFDPQALNRQLGIANGWKSISAEQIGRSLTWASLGLGAVELLLPGRVQSLLGLRPRKHTTLVRLLGAREMMSALVIMLAARPTLGVWSRVAGDAMDLGLLGSAFASQYNKKKNLGLATATIVGITAVDLLTGLRLRQQSKHPSGPSSVMPEDLNGRARDGGFHVSKSITINASPEVLYQFWRNFENLPRIMYHLESVHVIDQRRSHWVAKAPAGKQVAWDAQITDDQPNTLISWQSLPNATVPNSGVVRFKPAPAGRGTVVHVEIEYHPPAGVVGKMVAMIFGEEPSQQIIGDLNRFKQVIETGEVVLSEGSPQGRGQKMQHPGRPLNNKAMLDNKMTGKSGLSGKQSEQTPRPASEKTTGQ